MKVGSSHVAFIESIMKLKITRFCLIESILGLFSRLLDKFNSHIDNYEVLIMIRDHYDLKCQLLSFEFK